MASSKSGGIRREVMSRYIQARTVIYRHIEDRTAT